MMDFQSTNETSQNRRNVRRQAIFDGDVLTGTATRKWRSQQHSARFSEVSNLIEIKWHSRAGNGAITAAGALAEIIGQDKNYHVQVFPEYGAEKRGAPVVVFNRISKNKIDLVSKVSEPEIVLLLDPTLVANGEVSREEVITGLDKKKGILIINTTQEKTWFSKKIKNVYHLDASQISIQEIGLHIPNVPMLGALIKVANLEKEEKFAASLQEYLSSCLPPEIVKGNVKAFTRGYKEVKKIETPNLGVCT